MKTISIGGSNNTDAIALILDVIGSGGIVVCPTDTVYGLLADAHNEKAIEKLISIKKRPHGKPISVFVADTQMMKDYVEVTTEQLSMINSMVPGPYTLILQSKHLAQQLLESEHGTLGIRIPDYDLARDIARRLGRAVTATSANLAGRSPVHSIEALSSQMGDKRMNLIDLIVDAGTLPSNKPSTVVDLTGSTIEVLRAGDAVTTQPARTFTSTSVDDTEKIASQLLDSIDVAKKPVCILISGELGAGKTQFVKGLALSLGIANIISPTYVIYYEYDVDCASIQRFVHADLYNIEHPEEYEHLGLERYMMPGTLLAMEWGERSAPIYDTLKKHCVIYNVSIEYENQDHRKISISHSM